MSQGLRQPGEGMAEYRNYTPPSVDPTPVCTARKFPSNIRNSSWSRAHAVQQVSLLDNGPGKDAEAEVEGDEDRSHSR